MKKLITLFLVLVLSVAFVACGDPDNNDKNGNTENTPEEEIPLPGNGMELPIYPIS